MHDPRDPLLDPYVIGPALAVVGGVVSYIQRLRKRKSPVFSAVELVGECVIAGFTGYVTMLLCAGQGIAPEFSAAAAGIAGHMGSRALFLIERSMEQRFGKP